MARGLNKVVLIGNLGKDPDVKYLENGTAVCRFTLATNDAFTNDKGERIEKTEWHNITAWSKLAEICGKYLKKGSKIYLEGKLLPRDYEKEGVKHYTYDIRMNDMIILTPKGDSEPEINE
ncbi:MAG: single-stranded DNA-binding protein, partial [Ignavibacteria bacterium]|nr:single-stranded DNA-binding protein [Ignavibacteria bacterium]